MSDPKNISPLLDGFTLGVPICEHHGVVCYPAIRENTNKKYIVKIISVPATQVQFDAMLLAGAYKDPSDAMEYFRESGESILNEAEVLKHLSKIEGFLPYEGWQMEPIARRRLGYEVCLVGSYKRSLDKYIRKNAFTHLEAVNLALDLCAALTVCRQSGFLYADLKPSNIFVSEKKEYRIGDLGFLNLDSLRYASLPERYFSPYTPRELLDPMEPMNLTVDTYAVGMILYQLYNDGQLPFSGTAPLEELPTPCHADYEMAEIIMKAIHPDPAERWTDPKDLGKAIASYMQRNSINDIPITPFIPLDVKPEDIVVISHDSDAESDVSEQFVNIPVSDEEPTDQIPATGTEEPETQEDSPGAQECSEDITELPEDSILSVQEQAVTENTDIQVTPDNSPEEPTDSECAADTITEPEESQEDDDLSAIALSDDVARIISRADDLIAHTIPSETAFPSEPEQPDPFAFAAEEDIEPEDDFPVDPLMDEPASDSNTEHKKKVKHFENPARKNKFKKFISGCFTFLLLSGMCLGGYWYYQNVYLQIIDSLSISGTQDQITVLVDTGVEESKLTVHCTDQNGKRQSEHLQGGKVIFSDLQPSTQYTIQLDMTGLHKLVGKTSDVFTTDATTQILSFQAIAGPEDGSVMLEFSVNGSDPDFWNIRYTAEGEEEGLETVTGHSATVTGLTVGKVYTFTLDGGKDFDVGGETSVQYLASRLILAEDITVTSSGGSDITVHWKNPGDVIVDSWFVRCYDGYGFEKQVTVSENEVQFSGIDPASSYTVEITAAGMTQPSRIRISADPINITSFQVDETSQTELEITWEYSGIDPEGGWLLIYTVEGSSSQVIQCKKASAEIAPLIPGANYKFTLQAADSRSVFNNMVNYRTKDAEVFSEHNFVSEDVAIDLLKTPSEINWHFETITEDSFTNTFRTGDSASMVLRSTSAVYLPSNKTKVLFIFRDSYGNVIPELVTEVSCTWKSIWVRGDVKTGEINIPRIPDNPGTYIMELYFNGCTVGQFDITITE